MVRSLLGAQPSTSTPTLATSARVTPSLSGAALQARLRLKRSSAYIQAVTRLDAGGHVHSPTATQALIDAIRQELPDVSVDALPHGIVARCYLGAPFEVHTLDCSGRSSSTTKPTSPCPRCWNVPAAWPCTLVMPLSRCMPAA